MAHRMVRTVFVGTVYVALYAAVDSYCQTFETIPNLGQWQLQSGLPLVLLLTFGLAYGPWIVLAQVLGDLWLNPLPVGPVTVWQLSLSTAAIHWGVSAVLLRKFGRSGIASIQSRRGLAILALGILAASVGVALTTALHLVMADVLAWSALSRVVLDGSLGIAAGVLAVSPFLLVTGAPFFRNPAPGLQSFVGRAVSRRGATGIALITVSTLGLLWLVFTIPVENTFLRFCALSLPILWLGLATGITVTSGAVFGLGCGFAIATGQAVFSLTESMDLQVLMFISSANGLLVAAAVTESKQAGLAGAYREAVLSSVGFLSSVDKWEAGLEELLFRLGQTSQACSACLFDCRNVRGKLRPELTEWVDPGSPIDPGALTSIREQQFLQSHVELRGDEVCHQQVTELSERCRAIAKASGIQSTVWLPITVQEELWGGLALDRGLTQRDWEPFEIQALGTVARNLGRLLAHAMREEQFRQLTGNLRAVLWRSSPDARDRTYVSPAYEQIWGRSRKHLRDRPQAWLDVVHGDDASVVEAALLEGREYEQEYRIILPDRSLRWIRDRGFPVRTASGDILQFVGIAEDITAHKKSEEKIRSTTQLLSTLIENLRSGILVEDESGKVRHVNRVFCEIFNIAAPRETLQGVDSRVVVSNSEPFLKELETTKRRGVACLGKELELDSRRFSRDYVPLSLGPQENYHLWQYREITQEKQAEERIRASLREKEVLLQEIHHRVKNNLQVVCSLLSLQSAQIRDKQAFQLFEDSQNRVRAMALVHERLYKSSDLARIDFPGYVQHLTDHLMRSCRSDSRRVGLKIQVEPSPMSIDVAVPCGLIINELVSNSLKHAFPDGRKGEILVRLTRDDGSCSLLIRDNGIGFEKAVALRDDSQSLGLKLVKSLTEQIGGTLRVSGANGASFEIRFPQNGVQEWSRSA